MTPPLGRRSFLGVAGAAAAALTVTEGSAAQAAPHHPGSPRLRAARVQSFPLTAVTLLAGPFQDNQRRNTAYLRFVDIDRLLHTFRPGQRFFDEGQLFLLVQDAPDPNASPAPRVIGPFDTRHTRTGGGSCPTQPARWRSR
ncbi:hypothetical protein [Streptomyces sp. NPDC001135]